MSLPSKSLQALVEARVALRINPRRDPPDLPMQGVSVHVVCGGCGRPHGSINVVRPAGFERLPESRYDPVTAWRRESYSVAPCATCIARAIETERMAALTRGQKREDE